MTEVPDPLAVEDLACSRLSVSVDDRKSERATSGISCERDPGVLYQTPLVARPLFQSSTLTESLEQAIEDLISSKLNNKRKLARLITQYRDVFFPKKIYIPISLANFSFNVRRLGRHLCTL